MKTSEHFFQDQQLFSPILRKKSQKELMCQNDAIPNNVKNDQKNQKALFLLSNFTMLKNKSKYLNSSFFEDQLSKTSQPLLMEKKISISQHNKVPPNFSLLRQIMQPQKQQYEDKSQQRISAVQDQYFQNKPNLQLKQISNCSLNNIENSPLLQYSKGSSKNIEILKKCETERYQSLRQREFTRYQEKSDSSMRLEPNELSKQQNFTQVLDQSFNTNCEIIRKGQPIKQLFQLDQFQAQYKKTQQPFFKFQDINLNELQNNNFISNSKYFAKETTQFSQQDLDIKMNKLLQSEGSLLDQENFSSTKYITKQNQNKKLTETSILIKQRSLTKQEYGCNTLKHNIDQSFNNQKEQNALISNRAKLLNLQKLEKHNLFYQIFQNNLKKQTNSPNNKTTLKISNNTSGIAATQIEELNQSSVAQINQQLRGTNSLNRISKADLINQQAQSEQLKINNDEQKFKIQISIFPVDLNDFKFLKELGHGSYATVRSALHKKTNFVVAVKSYNKSKLLDPQKKQNLDREIKILQNLNHKYIIKLYKVIENSQSINLVMEYSSSIPLSVYLKQKSGKRLHELEAKVIFRQILEAVLYLHKKRVIHRDIKLENILINSNRKIKLIDFGFSIQVQPSCKLTMFCGTPNYMAPEIINKKGYSFEVDIWALGILLYKLLTGYYPFAGKENKQLYKNILKCQPDYPMFISPSAQNLLQSILKEDPEQRKQLEDILQDEWF
ncbi:Serine/Threonine kinase domain protein (macronuclear) [Tetrahymena thermophila SB210]|uniref:Serine/Threonine kinase domain protein n=1 Tax=Tetrahymena thermophila (strain SB210) TaxID=312017 RepID=I7M9C0_TETTS|nr:Serine/Threonine kinase domain protein [Tetrahymena thermophila SB210]EAS01298.2 Serine/Threonine kinase domain protein [Tetrahymena thermophila SB210]|eukprot:XP_001021543.2 Serine/Threonine kinase domain protein [Tetrahymena thermophila SB210]